MVRFNIKVPVVFGLLCGPASADDTCPSEAVWASNWVDKKPETAQEKQTEITALEEYAFTLQGEDAKRLGVRTNGMLIIQKGQILYEKYARGFASDNPHLMWSISKSALAAITGRAVFEGYISLEDSICNYYSEIPATHCEITVLDLLRFSSGLQWKEMYEEESNQQSSVLAMFYGVGSMDMAKFAANHPRRDPPGTSFSYSSGDANILSAVIGNAVTNTEGENFPWTLLFDPLGMKDAVFERDAAGTYIGSAFLYLTLHDAAKLGAFYLYDGCWENTRLLPQGWVTESTKIQGPIVENFLCCGENSVGGWSWWINKDLPSANLTAMFPDLPEDTFFSMGHWGQLIVVIPSWEMIIVRTGDDRDQTTDSNKLMHLAMQVGTRPTRESQ